MANEATRLTDPQRARLKEALRKLDIKAKCELYHNAETNQENKHLFFSPSEFVYDELFLNEDSPYYQGE